MLSYFQGNTAPYGECIAISRTADPVLGGWYLYSFNNLAVDNDYPKFGVWPDAYYMGSQNAVSGGSDAWAFDRANMLLGNPVIQPIRFTNAGPFMLPSDLKGPAPPSGAPNVFLRFNTTGTDKLNLIEFHVNWGTPALSTFAALPDLPTNPFNPNLCNAPRGQCIAQPGTTERLEDLSGFVMYPLQYRNFGSYETLVVNDMVNITGHGGIRWYELHKIGGSWSIFQQGDYSPDSSNRWDGSIGMDKLGNLALAYSASDNNTVYPSILYTGRLAGDPLGTLPQGENSLINGIYFDFWTPPRWGDYSAMKVDPTDDCTFWFTTEYMNLVTNGTASQVMWDTRIGALRFPTCDVTTISTTIVNSTTGSPLGGSPPTILAGQSVKDTAALSGTTGAFTGNVIYNLFNGPNCNGTTELVVSSQDIQITTPGVVPSSNPVPINAAGDYGFQASYTGDFYNSASTSVCEPLNVLKRPSQTATTSSQTGIVPIGKSVNDTAIVQSIPPGATPSPRGNVTFFLCYLGVFPSSLGCTAGTQVGSPVTLSGSPPTATSASVSGSTTPNTLTTGTYCWRAVYSGSPSYLASNSTSPTNECFIVSFTQGRMTGGGSVID